MGPITAANLPKMSKKPKYSLDRSAGISLPKWDREMAWMPPWTVPTKKAMHQNSTSESCTAPGSSGWFSILKPIKKPTSVMKKYMATAPHRAFRAPIFPASLPKRMEKGTATIWVIKRAKIMLILSSFSLEP